MTQPHQQYGLIVSISPYELHINGPAYDEKLYCQDGRWNQYDWSYDAFGSAMCAICTVDHDMRRPPPPGGGAFFYKARVASRQGMIQGFADKLYDRLLQFEGATVNITAAVSALTRDFAVRFVLAKDYRTLEHETFQFETINLLSSGAIWSITKHVRWFGPLMKSLPTGWIEKAGDPAANAFFGFLKVSWIVSTASLFQ
ncbi:putative cytochrome p450 [Diaporthe ampelina]|uniref:Putative cytochrome p450 n=1 Tax=Diaporthe ampelina TaxID=1214573 RepID=A0A0G2FKI1_9PEZI|nr:putative cytochrome p450 [Diaporthe ampelina]